MRHPTTSPSDATPLLRVVRGDPTPEELAALTAVIAARASAAEPSDTTPSSGWTDPAARLRTPLPVGQGAWRASGRIPGTRTRADW